jgi:3'-5' exoribonuclease
MADMPRRAIADMGSADRVEQVFLVSQPRLRTTTRGDYYIAAFLSDRTGRLNGRMWQASEDLYRLLPEEGFAWIKGRTENYQGALQLVIEALRPVDAAEVNLEDFLPRTERRIDEMFNRVKEILATVRNPHLRKLIQAFLNDLDLMRLFCKAPAAIALHHAYLGGLLEHTLSLMELGQRILPQYLELDGDLVLTALFLHDIGKTTELGYDVGFKYTDQGRLLGHITKGAMLIEDKLRQVEISGKEQFPPLLRDHLIHIIVSHHGRYEYGCPVLPATPEAFAVHHLDNLDSKVALTLEEIKKNQGNTHWTNYVKAIESPVFKVRSTEE